MPNPVNTISVGAPILRVRDLRAHLDTAQGAIRAVDGVSFDLNPGETLCLVGESGCGKSMTALALMGLLPRPAGRITSGTVDLAGEGNLVGLDSAALRRIRGSAMSMVFQEPMTSLNPVFRIGWQIAEAIRVHQKVGRAQARQRAIELLDLVGIASPQTRCDAFPHQLSGGMRQRAMIAMALACRPRVILADEPTTALDVTIQAQILRLMNRLKREVGAALLLITHDLGVVAQMAQRVCVMYAGVIVEQAEVRELFGNPLHPYTRGLLASMPGGRGAGTRRRLATIPGIVPALNRLPQGCRFADRCDQVHDRCRAEEPPLEALPPGPSGHHALRCWLRPSPPA
jgi:peptide/nickel transport system ATP-binding protein